MDKIEITVRHRDYTAIIDPDDLYLFANGAYLTSKSTKDRIDIMLCIDGKRQLLSRIITQAPASHYIKFNNDNRLDFRKSNLTVLTRTQFLQTRKQIRNKISQYHGVTFNNSAKRWIVSLISNGVLIRDHYYKVEEEAGIAADYKMRLNDFPIELYNFPDLTDEEITIKYKTLRKRYGETKSEIKTRAQQGTSSAKKTTSQYVGVSFDKRGRNVHGHRKRNIKVKPYI